MIRRVVALALLFAGLAGLCAVSRASLEARGAGEGASGLLYLPKGPFLRATAVGHEDTLADLLYIWAIQYYSNYDDQTRYEYVDAVFRGAVTELDPHYSEAYLIGALIMSVEARRPDLALRLFDKGIANNPGDWELAYWAGWEAYQARRFDLARGYFERASKIHGAPPQLIRLAARMLEMAGDRRAAIAEYRAILARTTDEGTRKIVSTWLDRLLLGEALDQMRAGIDAYKARRGHCPTRLEALVAEGIVDPRTPLDMFRYDAARCEVLPVPGASFKGGK